MGRIIPYMMENKKCMKPPTRLMFGKVKTRQHRGVHKWEGVPQNGWFILEILWNWMIWGYFYISNHHNLGDWALKKKRAPAAVKHVKLHGLMIYWHLGIRTLGSLEFYTSSECCFHQLVLIEVLDMPRSTSSPTTDGVVLHRSTTSIVCWEANNQSSKPSIFMVP